MSIFKRSRDSAAEEPAEAASGAPGSPDAPAEAQPEPEAADPRAHGPWDVSEVDGRGGRMDLGGLWIRGAPGMELRLEVDKATSQVNAATAVLGESALQLQAFAAPRSAGLWDEIRAEIAAAVEGQGGTAEEHEGELGTHLRARMPSQGPDGRTVFAKAGAGLPAGLLEVEAEGLAWLGGVPGVRVPGVVAATAALRAEITDSSVCCSWVA